MKHTAPSAFGSVASLEKLARYYEESAASIRRTITVIAAHRHASSTARAAATLRGAIKHEAARVGPTAPAQKPKRPRGQAKAAKQKRRKATAAYLALFNPKTPRAGSGGDKAVGTLLRHGYLAKSGAGYLRTAKPFSA